MTIRYGILSTIAYDPDGFLPLEYDDQTQGLWDWNRRASIVPTLDGGVFVDSMGVFDAGRIFAVATSVDDEQMKLLSDLCRSYERLQLATEGGLFEVVSLQFGFKEPTVLMQLHVIRRLDNG